MADYTDYATPAAEWVEFENALGSQLHPQTLPNKEEYNFARAETFRRVLGSINEIAKQDIIIPTSDGQTISCRIYRSGTDHAATRPPPLYIHFHGGGFYFGNLETEDVSCALICKHTNTTVLSVNYRHTPEWTFPTAVYDAWDAFSWATGAGATTIGHDQRQVVVGGASAGAALALATALQELELEGTRITGVNLIMPPTVHPAAFPTHLIRNGYTSQEQNANAPLLPKLFRVAFGQMYKVDDPTHRYVSPLNLPDDKFRKYPKTVVHIAGMDPLRDEGLLFEEKLRRVGVETKLRIYKGFPHVFMNIPQLKMSGRWREDLNEDILWLVSKAKSSFGVL